MPQNIQYYSKREEWGHGEGTLYQNSAEPTPNPTTPCPMSSSAYLALWPVCTTLSLYHLSVISFWQTSHNSGIVTVWSLYCNTGLKCSMQWPLMALSQQLQPPPPKKKPNSLLDFACPQWLWNHIGGIHLTLTFSHGCHWQVKLTAQVEVGPWHLSLH